MGQPIGWSDSTGSEYSTMSVVMTKGGNVSLSKEAHKRQIRLRRVAVACGWDPVRKLFSSKLDLDLSAALRGANGKLPDDNGNQVDPGFQNYFVWANHREDPELSTIFTGDNRTGEDTDDNKDDEIMLVDLDRVAPHITSISFQVVIWKAEERNQTFGKVKNCFIRIYVMDEQGNETEELARFDIPDEFSEETLVVFGELYRYKAPTGEEEWKFRAIGQGYTPEKFREDTGVAHTFETDWARFPD